MDIKKYASVMIDANNIQYETHRYQQTAIFFQRSKKAQEGDTGDNDPNDEKSVCYVYSLKAGKQGREPGGCHQVNAYSKDSSSTDL